MLETVVRAVYDCRGAVSVTHYEFFAPRDGDSTRADLLCQFGLLRVDFTPKPAFDVYRRLIAELGAAA